MDTLATLDFGRCFIVFIIALAPACTVGERHSGLPPAAQNAIDTISDDITAGRDDKIYEEAAAEWRQAATPEQSHASFERVRNSFGRTLSRALVEGRDEQSGTGALQGHTLTATFNTRFERGDAIETFTLVEREGRWRLARYAVHSDVLR
jgi:hypothetical protein